MRRQPIAICISLVLLLCFSVKISAQELAYQAPVQSFGYSAGYVSIDPRMELLAGVLSQTSWITTVNLDGPGNDYFRSLQEFFAPYKNHLAMQLAEKLNKSGFNWDAPATFVLNLGQWPTLESPVNGYETYLVERAGGIDNLEALRRALIDLAAVSGFHSFLEEHQQEYKLMVDSCIAEFDAAKVVNWSRSFYGGSIDGFGVVLAPAMFAPTDGVYHRIINLSDVTQVAYQVILASRTSTSQPSFPNIINLERLSYQLWGAPLQSFNTYLSRVESWNLNDLYRPVATITNCSQSNYIIRSVQNAIEALALRNNYGEAAYEEWIDDQIQNGLFWVPLIVGELERYQTSRDIYPTFDTFLPEILRRLYAEKDQLTSLSNELMYLRNSEEYDKVKQTILEHARQTRPLVIVDYDKSIKKGAFPVTIEALPFHGYDYNLAELLVKIDQTEAHLQLDLIKNGQIMIDTTDLKDGVHNLVITAVDNHGNKVSHVGTFLSQNTTILYDLFDNKTRPIEFGQADASRVRRESTGWSYASIPAALFGDTGRKVLQGSASAYMTWEVPHLSGFDITLYITTSQLERLDDLMELSISDDGVLWTNVQTEPRVTTSGPDAWTEIQIGVEITEEAKWLRLRLNETAMADLVQIGKVNLHKRLTVDEPRPSVLVEIDPRMELMAGVLSHTSWMDTWGPVGSGNEYFRELKEFFSPYIEHPAIKLMQTIHGLGFSQQFVLSLGPLPELLPPPQGSYDSYLVLKAGGVAKLEALRLALVDLVKVSGFNQFLEEHKGEYGRLIEQVGSGFVADEVIRWMGGFYGWTADEYRVVLEPAMFDGNFGLNSTDAEGKWVVYQFVSTKPSSTGAATFRGRDSLLALGVHEWGHSFMNPSLEAHYDLANQLGLEELYNPVSELISRLHYGTFKDFLFEQVLRASEALYFRDLIGETAFRQKLIIEANQGFYFTPLIVQEFERYRANRDVYPTFDAFVPDLLRRIYVEKGALLNLAAELQRARSVADNNTIYNLLDEWLTTTAPVIYVEFDKATVCKDFPVNISTLPVYGYDCHLVSLAVEVDGVQVFTASDGQSTQEVVIDTTVLPDGLHQLSIIVSDNHQNTSRSTSTFLTDNWSDKVDRFDKPVQNSWFGVMEVSQVSKASAGWVYADAPEYMFDDAGRKVHTGDKPEFFIWETPGLYSYSLTLYMAKDQVEKLDNLVQISASLDGETWYKLDSESCRIVNEVDGWVQVILSGRPLDKWSWFKLESAQDATSDVMQVGEVVFSLWIDK